MTNLISIQIMAGIRLCHFPSVGMAAGDMAAAGAAAVPMVAVMAVANFMAAAVVGTVADTADASCVEVRTGNEDHSVTGPSVYPRNMNAVRQSLLAGTKYQWRARDLRA